jgi:O-antigen biosynthesis protein
VNESNLVNSFIAFDQYQRYGMTSKVLSFFYGQKKLRVLEIGANTHQNLEKFLGDRADVTYLDKFFDRPLKDNEIQADACDMPDIPSSEYDCVVALDVFEHIHESQRKNFVEELIRVSKDKIIIAAPFYDPSVQSAELRANEYFKAIHGVDYPWLKEHIDLGLPEVEKLKIHLRRLSSICSFESFGHGEINVWEMMIKLHFLSCGLEDRGYLKFIDNFYNQNIFKTDFGETTYRQFFVITKNKDKRKTFFSKKQGACDGLKRFVQSEVTSKEYLDHLLNQIKEAQILFEIKRSKAYYEKVIATIEASTNGPGKVEQAAESH